MTVGIAAVVGLARRLAGFDRHHHRGDGLLAGGVVVLDAARVQVDDRDVQFGAELPHQVRKAALVEGIDVGLARLLCAVHARHRRDEDRHHAACADGGHVDLADHFLVHGLGGAAAEAARLVEAFVVVPELDQDDVADVPGQQQVVQPAFRIGVAERPSAHRVVHDPYAGRIEQPADDLAPAAHRRLVEGVGLDRGIAQRVDGGQYAGGACLRRDRTQHDFRQTDRHPGLLRFDLDVDEAAPAHVAVGPVASLRHRHGLVRQAARGVPEDRLGQAAGLHAGHGNRRVRGVRCGLHADRIRAGSRLDAKGHAEVVVMIGARVRIERGFRDDVAGVRAPDGRRVDGTGRDRGGCADEAVAGGRVIQGDVLAGPRLDRDRARCGTAREIVAKLGAGLVRLGFGPTGQRAPEQACRDRGGACERTLPVERAYRSRMREVCHCGR